MIVRKAVPATLEDAACRRFLYYFYLARFCYDFIFAYAVYTVFFSLRGMSVLQISLLLSWWTLTSLLLEIPTGALADVWSRRKMLALAPLIKALCFVTWFLAAGNFYLYVLGFLCWSLGSTCVSGTAEALLYDTLARYGRTEEYARVLGRQQFFFYLALAIACLSGGLIANSHIEWAILLSVIPLLCSSLFALRLADTPKGEAVREQIHYWQHIRLALREIRHNRVLLYLLVYLLGISVLGDLEEYEQLYFRQAGLPVFAFGIAVFTGSLLNALGSHVAHRMKHLPGVLYILPGVSAGLLLLVWRYPSIPVIGLYLLSFAVVTPVQVLVDSRIQHNITGASRATVTSATSLFTAVFAVGTPVAFGIISQLWRLPAIFLATAIQLFVLAVWAFAVRRRMRAEK